VSPSPHPESQPGPRLNALTSLRFGAAAMVVLSHVGGHFGLPGGFTRPFNLAQGVTFFFVLSGFILTWVYPTLGHVGPTAFWRARIARIWPGHLAALALFLLLFHVLPRSWTGLEITPLLANAVLVHAWIPAPAYYASFNVPSWSSDELLFYLVFPLLIRNWNRTWWIKLAGALGLAWGLFACLNAVAAWNGRHLAYTHPLARLPEFVFGMSLPLIVRWAGSRAAPGRRMATLIEAATVTLAVLAMAGSGFLARAAVRRYAWLGDTGETWLGLDGALCVPFFGLLIVVMALERGRSRASCPGGASCSWARSATPST
jgi:peptidoglycan/LPS O-acetylase OafA/YrhL